MKLIVNADDFGLSEEVNEAVNICFSKGWIQRTTLLVNMPQTDRAVELSERNGYKNHVGLHINLIEGKPLTDNIKHTALCDKNGNFNGQFFQKISHRIFLKKGEKKAVQEEIEEQIKCYLNYGFELMHIDSHQHSHVNLSIFFILLNLAENYRFHSIRLSRNLPVKEIRGIKKMYKNWINHIIIRFNQRYFCKTQKQFLGSREDCEKEDIKSLKFSGSVIEMMVHPVFSHGMVVDNFTGVKLFQ